MKVLAKSLLIFSLLFICTTLTYAQGNPPVAGATLVGAFTHGVLIDDNDPNLGQGVIKEIDVEFEIWLTNGGETVMSIDVESMEFGTPCEWAETYSLEDLMNEVAHDGLIEAVALGYINCSVICPAPVLTKVYYPTCVKRDLTGTCPSLLPASGTSWSYNSYSVCCTGGTPTVTLVSKSCGGTSCGTGYELTCN